MKRKSALWLLASLWSLGVCSCTERDTSEQQQPIGAGHGEQPSDAGVGGMAALDAGYPTLGGTGGIAVAGEDNDAGSALDAGVDAGAPRAVDPRIPPPPESCPELITGTQTILGLEVDILAGAPGATPGPLLFIWHGNADTGANALARLQPSLRDDIMASGGIIVAPNDTMTTRDGRDIAVSLDLWFDSDFDVADQIVACAVQNHNVDPRRIYVTGCFAGGLMAGTMTVARSSYVAGAMFESGGIAIEDWPFDEPRHAPTVIALQGYHDELVIDTRPLADQLGERLAAAGGTFILCEHNGPKCNGQLELYEQAWSLLKAHPFGSPPDFSGGLPAEYPEYCKIYE